MKYILDENNQPVHVDDIDEWAKFLDSDRRRVALDEVDGVRVSTVFMGLDHGFGRGSNPILWETMIFGGSHDGYQERYDSLESARAGHAKALALVSAGRC